MEFEELEPAAEEMGGELERGKAKVYALLDLE